MAHNHSHWVNSENKKWLLISIILNSFIVIAEFVGWILAWSLALLSDAIHNLSDVIALILSYIWELLWKKKSDKKHTFAFKRVEVIIAFVNSLALILIWFYIIYEAIIRFFSKTIEINSSLMLIIWAIWFLWNFISIFFLYKEKDDNLNKKSAYLHLLYDTISSVLVVIWWIIIYHTNWFIIDLIASIVISIFVIKSWFEVFKDSTHILMQWTPEWIDLEEMKRYIESFTWITDVHDLHVWNINSNDIFMISHIVITKGTNVENIIKELNEKIEEKYSIHHTSFQVVNEKCC